ncbi:MAG: DUF362 domain-containing protein [Candidatus Saganbacteria bacterium]|nr:DUF362 domain-containing protein [Candidatus Saganbacteria bacterium]
MPAGEGKSRVSLVECSDYDLPSVDTAIQQSFDNLGGLARFVKPGQTVLIKPNALLGASPEHAVTTHPAIISAVIKAVIKAGAAALVGDSPGNAYANAEKTMSETGIKAAAEAAGGKMVYFQTEGVARLKSPSGGTKLPLIPIARPVLDADAVINLAKLKTHGLTLYTGAIKNMFGSVPGFNKTLFHLNCQNPRDFAAAIVDVYELTKPELNIIDAVVGMEGRGPSGGAPRRLGVIIASADGVAADAVGSYLMGYEPLEIGTTALAYRRGLGEARLEKIEVVGGSLEAVRQADWRRPRNLSRLAQYLPPALFRFLAGLVSIRPVIDQSKCTRCRVCLKNCPAKTIHYDKERNKVEIDHSNCIYCFCCHELCPYKAIALKKSRLAKLLGL